MVSVIARPQVALVDEPVTISVTGLQAGQECTLHIETLDHVGQAWVGSQSFTASFDGSVDLREPMTLITAMTPGAGHRGGPFAAETTTTLLFSVRIQSGGVTLGETELHRVLRDVGVSNTPIRQDGLIGTLYLPPGPGPHPGVLVLAGGGRKESTAALLASRGFAALAVSYVGADGLPPVLSEVPLEKIEAGLELLSGHLAVAGQRVAILGSGKGGELALLAAASFPDLVHSVATVAGSPVMFSGLGDGEHMGAYGRSSWAYHGVPVPFVQLPLDEDLYQQGDRSHRKAYERALENRAAVAGATVPLERIDGGVLLVSGTDDRVWPADALADLAARLLREKGRRVEHVSYSGAGHHIDFPYLPAPSADARAAADSWPRIIEFLKP